MYFKLLEIKENPKYSDYCMDVWLDTDRRRLVCDARLLISPSTYRNDIIYVNADSFRKTYLLNIESYSSSDQNLMPTQILNSNQEALRKLMESRSDPAILFIIALLLGGG